MQFSRGNAVFGYASELQRRDCQHASHQEVALQCILANEVAAEIRVLRREAEACLRVPCVYQSELDTSTRLLRNRDGMVEVNWRGLILTSVLAYV